MESIDLKINDLLRSIQKCQDRATELFSELRTLNVDADTFDEYKNLLGNINADIDILFENVEDFSNFKRP